mgnify:CR=1 FL=1
MRFRPHQFFDRCQLARASDLDSLPSVLDEQVMALLHTLFDTP